MAKFATSGQDCLAAKLPHCWNAESSGALPQGDILGFAPPLCLTREEADIIVVAATDPVESVTATL